jgi:hypothetical protein
VRYEERGKGYRDVENVGKHCSTCFEQTYCSSSGGNILYIQQMVYVMLNIFHYFQYDIYNFLYIQNSTS